MRLDSLIPPSNGARTSSVAGTAPTITATTAVSSLAGRSRSETISVERVQAISSQFASVATRSERNEQDVLNILGEMNEILGTGLNNDTVALSYRLLEKRFDPNLLATIVNEQLLKRWIRVFSSSNVDNIMAYVEILLSGCWIHFFSWIFWFCFSSTSFTTNFLLKPNLPLLPKFIHFTSRSYRMRLTTLVYMLNNKMILVLKLSKCMSKSDSTQMKAKLLERNYSYFNSHLQKLYNCVSVGEVATISRFRTCSEF